MGLRMSARPRRPLHLRAALVAVPLFLLLGAAMFFIVRHYSAQATLEATQRLNLGLARYVVAHRRVDLIDAQGQPNPAQMTELAQLVMMINPAVEVYLLDRQGRVLAHALDGLTGPDPVGRAVDLGPVDRLARLAGAADAPGLSLPVLGDDPRRAGQLTVVSVAPVGAAGHARGYLYIVLDGQGLRTLSASLANSATLREIAAGLLLATLMAAAVCGLALRQLTRPLRDLAAEVETFRPDAAGADLRPTGDEIDRLRSAVRAQQQRIGDQFRRLEDSDQQRRELVSKCVTARHHRHQRSRQRTLSGRLAARGRRVPQFICRRECRRRVSAQHSFFTMDGHRPRRPALSPLSRRPPTLQYTAFPTKFFRLRLAVCRRWQSNHCDHHLARSSPSRRDRSKTHQHASGRHHCSRNPAHRGRRNHRNLSHHHHCIAQLSTRNDYRHAQ